MLRILHRLRRHFMGVAGAVLIAGLCRAAVLAPSLTSYDPNKVVVRKRLLPPTGKHWTGTDELGRDVLSRVLHGTRPSLIVGTVSTLLSTALGTLLGLAAVRGSGLDAVIIRVMDVLFAFPAILFALALITVLGTSLTNLIIALTIIYLPRMVRVVRASALQVREME